MRGRKQQQADDDLDDLGSDVGSVSGKKKESVAGTVESSDDSLSMLPYVSLSRGYTTSWGPIGFSKDRHPLSIMVRQLHRALCTCSSKRNTPFHSNVVKSKVSMAMQQSSSLCNKHCIYMYAVYSNGWSNNRSKESEK